MQAVILVGGLGTRLRPLSINTPKSMMPVANMPFIEYVIRHLQQHGIKGIILAISHLAEPIKKYIGNGNRFGVCINYTIEDTALGTAGAVKNAEQYLDYKSFVVLNGDIFTDLDLSAMISLHRKRRAKITIALTPVVDPTHYGLIETGAKHRVIRFLEKPSREQITTNMINAGTYIMETDVLNSIPKRKMFSFEREVFPPLLQKGEPIYAFTSSSYWMDIGTPQNYHQLNRDLLNGQSSQFRFIDDSRILIGKNTTVHDTVEVSNSVVIGNYCSVGQNVKLNGAVVIGDNSIIGTGAKLEDSIIWHNTEIEPGATIRHSIIANNCRIGQESNIQKTVISNNVSISAGCRLKPGSIIWPNSYFDKN